MKHITVKVLRNITLHAQGGKKAAMTSSVLVFFAYCFPFFFLSRSFYLPSFFLLSSLLLLPSPLFPSLPASLFLLFISFLDLASKNISESLHSATVYDGKTRFPTIEVPNAEIHVRILQKKKEGTKNRGRKWRRNGRRGGRKEDREERESKKERLTFYLFL